MANKLRNMNCWECEYGPSKNSTATRIFAIFSDANDLRYRAEISIPALELKRIGSGLTELQDKKRIATQVLRAMLEAFEGEIEPDELARISEFDVDMLAVKRRFTKGKLSET